MCEKCFSLLFKLKSPSDVSPQSKTVLAEARLLCFQCTAAPLTQVFITSTAGARQPPNTTLNRYEITLWAGALLRLCVQQDWGLHIRAASQPSLYSTVGSFASHHFIIIIIILNHSLHCTELSRAHRMSEATWVQFRAEPVRRSCIKVLL